MTYRVTPPGGAWDPTDNGDYRVVMRPNQVRDLAGHAVPGADIGVFRVNIPVVDASGVTAPAAQLQSIAAPQRGQMAQFLDVMYQDASAIRVPSLDNGDLIVTAPNGQAISAMFYDVNDFSDGAVRTARYWFPPPGGAWDYQDNGIYTVSLKAGAVRDTLLNATPATLTLGTFAVNISPPERVFPTDAAELNANEWIAWADGATASASDDASRKLVGQASILFETTGGFDTSLRFPTAGAADWDLSTSVELHFQVFADNPHTFQEGPWIRLVGVDGGYFEYRYYENGHPAAPLNDALQQWVRFSIPLNPDTLATGWRRTSSGTPTMQHIAAIEFHADTWDSGFKLWFDDIGPMASAWRNPVRPLDVDDDGVLAPLDALIIINELNHPLIADLTGKLPLTRAFSQPFYDVDSNGYCAPLDALLVINALNSGEGAEGEAGTISLEASGIPTGVIATQPPLSATPTHPAGSLLVDRPLSPPLLWSMVSTLVDPRVKQRTVPFTRIGAWRGTAASPPLARHQRPGLAVRETSLADSDIAAGDARPATDPP